ncbi:MAG: hypothetical protein SNJ80_14170 [Anaerolinea sp.]
MIKIAQLPQAITYPHGTQRYWIENGTIGVVVLIGAGRTEINEAAQAVYDLIQEAPNPAHVYVITHAENLGGLTPAVRQTVSDFFAHLPSQTHLTSAIILQDSLLHNLLNIFLNGLRRLLKVDLTYRIFRDEASAIAWLKEMKAQNS